MTHKEKVKLARHPGMQTRAERKKTQMPLPQHGIMTSQLFSSKAWDMRKYNRTHKQRQSVVAIDKAVA